MAAPASGIPNLRYPFKAIKDFDDYLEIQIVKYQPPGLEGVNGSSGGTSSELINKNTESPIATIILPIPQTIQDANSVGWGDNSLNAVEMAGANAVREGVQNPSLPGGLAQGTTSFIDSLKSMATGGNLQDAITGKAAADIVNLFGSNTSAASLISRATGQVLNPNMELLFTGVNLREFSFDFDFSPRDGTEAGQVKQIIRTFKQSMSAKTNIGGTGAGLFISAPDVFKLSYKSGGKPHPFLNAFKPMALKGMGVNYTGSGTYAVYGDSTPVHMKLSLNFQELNPIYYEDYNKPEAGTGVGF